MLNENEYQKKVTPSIIKLFASKDRSIRSKLLKEIDEYIDYTSTQAVNDQIFPYLVHGFMDSNPVIREQTVKVCKKSIFTNHFISDQFFFCL